jgi:hypothetical protein
MGSRLLAVSDTAIGGSAKSVVFLTYSCSMVLKIIHFLGCAVLVVRGVKISSS